MFHTNFSYEEEKNQWIAKHPDHTNFYAISHGASILGPQKWLIHNDSNLCNGSISYSSIFSFSSCTMEEFTCSDGTCVNMDKR